MNDPLARLRAVIAEAEAGPSVRALVWERPYEGSGDWRAPCLMGYYLVWTAGGSGYWQMPEVQGGKPVAGGMDGAKAAAQVHFAAAIRAALAPTPLPAAEEIAAAIRDAALADFMAALDSASARYFTAFPSSARDLRALVLAALRRADPRDGAERGA